MDLALHQMAGGTASCCMAPIWALWDRCIFVSSGRVALSAQPSIPQNKPRVWIVRVLIFGDSKGIGLATTRQALDAGYDENALAWFPTVIGFSNPKL